MKEFLNTTKKIWKWFLILIIIVNFSAQLFIFKI